MGVSKVSCRLKKNRLLTKVPELSYAAHLGRLIGATHVFFHNGSPRSIDC